ncbi:MAG: hypothetical protein ACXQT5_05765 [Candidatus Syntropharchaeia archaeon]
MSLFFVILYLYSHEEKAEVESLSAGCDRVVWKGTPVELSASSTLDNPVYEWREGEKILSTEKKFEHVFGLGVHTITVNATQSGTTLTDSVCVIVIEKIDGVRVKALKGSESDELIFLTEYMGKRMWVMGVELELDEKI